MTAATVSHNFAVFCYSHTFKQCVTSMLLQYRIIFTQLFLLQFANLIFLAVFHALIAVSCSNICGCIVHMSIVHRINTRTSLFTSSTRLKVNFVLQTVTVANVRHLVILRSELLPVILYVAVISLVYICIEFCFVTMNSMNQYSFQTLQQLQAITLQLN